MKPVEKLRAHSAEFEKTVFDVGDGVYTAVGYAASNSSMIIGDDGIIIIDTTESTGAASNIFAEFRKITDKPVRAIIYTHGHRDHISGASVFAKGGEPDIYARANLTIELAEGGDRPYPTNLMIARTKRQFGIGLEFDTERINLGLGPGDRPMEGLGQGFLQPTNWVEGERLDVDICGVPLSLIAAPGETEDHLVVWREKDRILFSGDNYYKSFPNLYAIRGTKYRDFDVWADTLDTLIALDPATVVPGHSKPLTEASSIASVLADYRDAIRHIVAKCAEGMDLGLTPDELVDYVRLPKELADRPFLQEYYGTVEWAVRAYFSGTVGWFDGNPTNLFPLAPNDEARRIADLAGGPESLASTMEKAVNDGEHQWALELADRVALLDGYKDRATKAKKTTLLALAENQVNANARNYYISVAKELG
ncbi:MAG: MBL fold metallo-hydrolase [Alphaproteobacteria bacterium]|nr:MBL fold metallo-hydrolase [Alphaproteobacteria bacterium]